MLKHPSLKYGILDLGFALLQFNCKAAEDEERVRGGVNKAKIIFALGLTWLLGSGLIGCAPQTSEPITITMVTGTVGKEFEVLQAQVSQFEAQHPGIRVELLDLPESTNDRREAYIRRLEQRDPTIDIYTIDIIWTPEFGARGWTIPLDEFVTDNGINIADFLPGIVQGNTWNGRLVSMPWFTDAGVLYYRQDLLDKYQVDVPRTWAELIEISKNILEGEKETSPNMVGFVFQGRQYEGLVTNYLEYVWSNGADALNETGDQVILNSPETVEALEIFSSMVEIAPVGVTSFQEADALNYFQSGNAIFMRNWPFAWAVLNDDDSPVKGQVGLAPLPHAPHGNSASTLGGWQLGISAYSQHPVEAFQLIAFLTSFEQQNYKAIHAAHNPTRWASYQDQAVLTANPHMDKLFEVFIKAKPRPVHPRYPEISEIIQREVHSVLTNQQDAATATKIMAADIQAIISDR